ncbi:hypothetical protein ACJ41O_005682 [Fusarium nematophilum]
MGNEVSKQVSSGIDDFTSGVKDLGKQITEGVGAVGQGIGDTFYYDNPNRRDRVEELRNDINTFKAEFDSLKEKADEIVADLQPKVDKLLRDNGFESADDMDQKMKHRLDPEALKKWEDLNRDIAIENMIFTITGILTVAVGVISGILIVFGVITVATGGLALEALGVVGMVLGAVVVILAAVDASKERDKLRDAINQLAFARVDAKQGLEQMRSYYAFVEQFNSFVDNELMGQHSEWFNDYSNHGYEKSLQLAVRPNIIKALKELDAVRGSWRNEDPDVGPVPAGKVDPVQKALDDIKAKKSAKQVGKVSLAKPSKPVAVPVDQMADMRVGQPIVQFVADEHSPDDLVNAHEFRLEKLVSRLHCEVKEVHTGDKWLIHANLSEPLPDMVNLKDVQFTMTNVTQNKVFSNCRWYLHGYRPLDAVK